MGAGCTPGCTPGYTEEIHRRNTQKKYTEEIHRRNTQKKYTGCMTDECKMVKNDEKCRI